MTAAWQREWTGPEQVVTPTGERGHLERRRDPDGAYRTRWIRHAGK